MKTLILVLTLLISPLTFAKDWQSVTCPNNLETVASELIEVQLSGAMVSKKSKCLDPSNFKYVESTHAAPSGGDFRSEVEVILNKDAQVKIINITPLEVGEYKINFSITSGQKTYKDEIQMLHYPRYNGQVSDNECAGVTVTPSKVYVRKNCL